jgi:non-specific serine/threonine protein kinase/serine/threonine-protein kinase
MVSDAARVKSIFLAAVERYPAEQWPVYLDGACGEDAELRERVEQLLGAHGGQRSLHFPLPSPPEETVARPVVERPGEMVGPYKLREQIGEGGMGVVYVAEQTQPVRRKVALKIIKPGMDTRQVIARFEAERQALAMMDHPNIAKVHDGGTTESGRPYFVMELVRGIPITEYCDRERLSIPERLELFVLVCRAVQHAHQKGIIHRDLKPSNILVTVIDGAAVPKVIDFGVAKATGGSLTERTLYTAFHQFVGTPLYMSPEQAELSGMGVDTRSDIYALGVLLYELLTGTTPFDQDTLRKAAFDEVRRIIREDEPPRPSTRISSLGETLTDVSAKRGSDPRRLGRVVRGELDWIVMKALEKERGRRYETANDFAADVMRYLTDQPVQACPPSAWYRFGKLARRHRAALVTSTLVATALVLGTAVSTWMAVRATRAQRVARQQRDAATASREAEGRARQRAEDAERTARNAERTARAEADKAKAVNEFLTEDLLTQAEPGKNAVEDKVPLMEVVDRAADKVGERFHDQPEAESALRMTLASTYHGLASFAKAQSQAQARLEIEQRLHGPEAAETFKALGQLGHMRYHLVRSSEALELLRQASEGLQRTLGPDNPDTLASRNNLAVAYLGAGRTAEAIALFEAILALREKQLGCDDPLALKSRANLALAYQAAGRLPEVLRMQEEILRLETAKLGPDHPSTLMSRNNVASAYFAAGRVAEAIALLEATLKPKTVRFGPDHSSTLNSRWLLTLAYERLGRWADAESLRRDALARRRKAEKPDSPHLAGDLAGFGQNLLRQGKWPEAESVLRESLAISVKAQTDDWRRFHTMSQLGGALLGQGRYAVAEPLVIAGYEGMRARESRIAVPDRSRLREAAGRVVQLYEAWGQPEKAAAWKAKLGLTDLPADVFARP